MRATDVWVTGFVAVAACATLALVYLATGTHWGIRQYAPVVQAVFSAAAIFAAFWLQERKRITDRNEAISDNTAAVAELLRSEEAWLARALSFSGKDKIGADFASLVLASSENALIMLRQQKAVLLKTPLAASAYVAATGHIARSCANLKAALEDVDSQRKVRLNWSLLEIAYVNIRTVRDIFLKEVGITYEPRRPPIAVADLPKWREDQDKWEQENLKAAVHPSSPLA
jgi:hypothetical protein